MLGSLLVAVPQVGATHKLATPTNVQATPGNAQVSLSADPVTNANQYRWQYGTHPSGTSTTAARGRTTAIGSLTNNQVYRVRVSARAITGGVLTHQDSDWSDWVTFTPHVPLNAPTDLSVSAGSAALSLSWTASTSTGVTGYDVHYTSAASSSVADGAAVTTGAASAGWVAVTRTGTTASQAIPSLSNGTPYRVRVRAKSSTGLSGWVFGSGTPTAASVTLSGPATVVEGQPAILTFAASPAISSTADESDRLVELLSALGTAESADVGSLVGDVQLAMDQGSATTTYAFRTYQDADQDDETFTLSLSHGPTGYSVGSPSSVTITIVDDDKPSVSLSASPNPVPEGTPVTITAQLSHPTVKALEIPVRLTAGTAESGDYGALSEITVAAGASSGSATITTTEDADDDEETFTVSFGELLPATVTAGSPTSVVVTISEAIRVTLGPANVFVAEGERATLLLQFSSAPPDAQSKAFAVITKRVTSEQGDHSERQFVTYYDALGGDRNTQVFIDTNVDYDYDDEVFTVELDPSKLPDGYELGAQSKVTVTIIEPPEASLSVSEERVTAGHPVTVTATLARPALADLQLWVKVTSGTADSSDYSASWYRQGQILAVNIEAGSTSGTTQVRTNGKDRDKCDETFTVSLLKRPRYELGNPSRVEVAIAGDNVEAEQCQPDEPDPEPEPEDETSPNPNRNTISTPQPTATTADPDPTPTPDLISRYDTNNNNKIDLAELLAALADYQAKKLTTAQITQLTNAYLNN